ncbi:MAG: hypothetical protein RML93_11090, partial [Anaerolineales bacterium]|nr:hypothetical protein [Anaerolineales bacterium]MDW8447821.1 hypothetical protein [Anaerolineales bacterium]
SSIGRLFDLVASLIGVRQAINYEAQAAIELEALASEGSGHAYPYELISAPTQGHSLIQIDVRRMVHAIVDEYLSGVSPVDIATRFHDTLSILVLEVCKLLYRETGILQVALSGGVWQNIKLLQRTCRRLRQEGFTVLTHREIPPNDGGISLGQVAIASKRQ